MGIVAPKHVVSSRTRDWTCVPCIGRQILNHWTTRKSLPCSLAFRCASPMLFSSHPYPFSSSHIFASVNSSAWNAFPVDSLASSYLSFWYWAGSRRVPGHRVSQSFFYYRKQASFSFHDLPWVPMGRFKQLLIREGIGGETREKQTAKSSLGAGSCFPIKWYTQYLWAILQILKLFQVGEVNNLQWYAAHKDVDPRPVGPEGWWCRLLLTSPPPHQKNILESQSLPLWTIAMKLLTLSQVGTYAFEGLSLLSPPLPGKAIMLSFSTSPPNTLSPRFYSASVYREAELLASLSDLTLASPPPSYSLPICVALVLRAHLQISEGPPCIRNETDDGNPDREVVFRISETFREKRQKPWSRIA